MSHRVVASVDVVAHEEVVGVGRLATDAEELHEVVKLKGKREREGRREGGREGERNEEVVGVGRLATDAEVVKLMTKRKKRGGGGEGEAKARRLPWWHSRWAPSPPSLPPSLPPAFHLSTHILYYTCPWMSPQMVTGHCTGWTLLSSVKTSLAWVGIG